MTSFTNPKADGLRGSIVSDGFHLAYAVEGQGKPVLVIGSAIYYPRTFSSELRDKLRLAFIDHRGFAKRRDADDTADYRLETVLADVDRLRRHLGMERVIVIGHSGHGYMALEYAKRYPRHVSHVVMIATGPSHSPRHAELTERHWQEAVCPARKARLEADIATLGAEIAAHPETRFITFCIRLAARQWRDWTYDPAPLWQGISVNMPMIDYMWGEVFRDIDIRDGLDRLEAPVFLALGRFDYLVAPASAWEEYRPAFRHLTLRVFDESGHTPQLEEAPIFDHELLAWLEANPA